MTTPQHERAHIPGEVIQARAGTYYRNTRYLMTVMCLAGGIWFGLDGWRNWPESNRHFEEAHTGLTAAQAAQDTQKIREFSEEEDKYKHHSEKDIWLQKVLACALPPIGVLLLAWSMHKSRGAYRLSGTTLSVPGHPDIQLDDITKIDKQKWDRKGIVYLHYTTQDNSTGIITLDDFIYDRPGTDTIFKHIEQYLLPAAEQPASPAE
ncbi:MAG TPA: hypothetical protein VFE58_12580 [Tepidisphaeraceae bacterium]|jgi:hypothetical protein|nr:hypothetical protein [Tepidisphaeraceae bacterium]